jgi:hypothetical protein
MRSSGLPPARNARIVHKVAEFPEHRRISIL